MRVTSAEGKTNKSSIEASLYSLKDPLKGKRTNLQVCAMEAYNNVPTSSFIIFVNSQCGELPSINCSVFQTFGSVSSSFNDLEQTLKGEAPTYRSNGLQPNSHGLQQPC